MTMDRMITKPLIRMAIMLVCVCVVTMIVWSTVVARLTGV